MKEGHVIEIGSRLSRLSHLEHSLILDHPLCHGGRVRVGDRNDINCGQREILGPIELSLGVPVILRRHVPGDNVGNESQLILERSMKPGMNRRHDLHRPLKQGQRSAHWALPVHVADFKVGDRRYSSSLINYGLQQLVEGRGWLLDRERHQVIPERPSSNINIPPFTGTDRIILVLDPETSRLEAGL